MNPRTSEQLGELAAALVAAQAEFSAIPKTAENPFYKSKYAPLAGVVASTSPVLAKHGLAVSQFLGFDDQGDTLTTWLIHQSGQYINESMRLHLPKPDAQGQGSATSYARRYAYMAVLGLVADADDDGNAASRNNGSARRSPIGVDDRRLSDDERDRVLAAVGAAGQQLRVALRAAGVNRIEDLTIAGARRVRAYLDSLPSSDVPAAAAGEYTDFDESVEDPETARIADEMFGTKPA